MKRAASCLISLFACLVQLPAQEAGSTAERQAKALKAAAGAGFENLITQHAKSGAAPEGAVFKDWLMMEMNNNSLLRDQIAEDVEMIETNGRNSGHLEQYFTTDGQYLGRLVFDADDVKVSLVAGGKGGVHLSGQLFDSGQFSRGNQRDRVRLHF